MVGLLLPFLTIPDMLAGKQVVLQVDNIIINVCPYAGNIFTFKINFTFVRFKLLDN
jgi:hypothetical protein